MVEVLNDGKDSITVLDWWDMLGLEKDTFT